MAHEAPGRSLSGFFPLRCHPRVAGLAFLVPATVVADLGLHLMRFALMENHLPRAAVLAFLKDLESALDGFVSATERYLASRAQSGRLHAELAIEHGIAMHRASLDWTRSALAALAEGPARG